MSFSVALFRSDDSDEYQTPSELHLPVFYVVMAVKNAEPAGAQRKYLPTAGKGKQRSAECRTPPSLYSGRDKFPRFMMEIYCW